MAKLTYEYPIIQGQTYGLILNNPENRPFLSPTYQILGDVRAAKRTVIRQWIERWLEFEKEEKDFEKIIKFDSPLTVGQNPETGGPIKRDLHSMKPLELVVGLEYRARQMHGSASVIRRGGDDVFNYNLGRERKGPKLESQTGNIVLSGFVRQKGDARKGPFRSSFHKITVKGPFEDSRIPFALLSNDSRYFQEINKKGGYGNIQIMDMDICALMRYVSENQNMVKDFRGNRTFFLPFRTDTVDENTLKFFNVEELPYLSSTVRDLIPLKIDILFARYFKNENYFTLDKILAKLHVFSLKIIEAISHGKAKWVVIPRKFPLKEKDKFENLEPAVAKLYDMIHRNLIEDGFELTDIVIEKKDSQYEVLCLHYGGPDNEIRRITLDGRPPLVIRRKMNPSAVVYPVRNIEGEWHVDGFAELYKKYQKGRLDDMTRTVSEYEVTLPGLKPKQFIPDSILRDYAAVIAEAIDKYNKKRQESQYPETFNRINDRARSHNFSRAARMIGWMRKNFFS